MKKRGLIYRLAVLSIVLGCLTNGEAHAQVRPMDLNQAIAIALQNNYEIQLSRSDSLLYALDNGYSKYAFFPTLNANGGLIYNRNRSLQVLKDTTRGGPVNTRNITGSVNLDWTIFDGFKMFITRKRLGQLVTLGELRIKAQVTNSVAEVMKLYYNIIRQQEQLKAIQEQLDLSGDRLKLARYKYEIGTGVKPDMLQAQIDNNAQRSSYLTQQATIIKLKDSLNQLIGATYGTEVNIQDSTFNVDTTLQLQQVNQDLKNLNPDLLQVQQNLVILDLALQERKAERYPTVQFNSSYNYNQTLNNSIINPITQPLLNRVSGYNYGLTATIPIFNGYQARRNITAAQLDIRQQQLIYDRSLAAVTTSLNAAWQDYDLARRSLQLEEENITLAQENLHISRERYRLGVTTFIEMRTAEQSLSDARFRVITARYNTKVAEIELKRLRGELIK